VSYGKTFPPGLRSTVLVIVGSALLLGAACTTHRAVMPAAGDAASALQIKQGDTIRVVTKYRDRLTLQVTEIRGHEVEGVTTQPSPHETVPAGKKAIIPYEDLAMVEVTRRSPGKTMGLVAVLTVVGAVVSGGVAVVPATAL
jgi:hypothetical protein